MAACPQLHGSNHSKMQWRRGSVPIYLLILYSTTETNGFSEGFVGSRNHPQFTRNILDNGRRKIPNVDPSSAYINKRRRQNRAIPTDRHPRNYWLDPTNLRRGLVDFWRNDCGLDREIRTVMDPTRPTIPNEVLLFYYQRHDLRAALARNGGREEVSEILGNAPIMPGRWRDAVKECPDLMQTLTYHDPNLSIERPPRIVTSNAVHQRPIHDDNAPFQQRTKYQRSESRKPIGYWSLQRLLEELYEHSDTYRTHHSRPSVWMPRPSELAAHGRDDLRQAVTRFGGIACVARTAGMVPYREWFYFEGQLELLLELRNYLDQHCDGDYKVFPNVSMLKKRGYHQLHSLIMYFGGRKFVAARLGMNANSSNGTMTFGSFDLDFAIRLLQFVRRDHLKRDPPMQFPCLAMPSRSKLLGGGEEGVLLDAQIDEFGGYENVARRLGLALFPLHANNHNS